MTEIILRELSSGDIDWMTLIGRKLNIAGGDRLLQPHEHPDALYLILEGELALISSQPQHTVHRIATYASGDVTGLFFLPSDQPLPIAVTALEDSLVLAIPQQALADKLHQDVGFSARFYRAIAMLLSRQQWQITAHLPKEFMLQSHLIMTKSIFSVFGCLFDSDMCWMTSAGKVKRLKEKEIYLREGQPLEALDIVLQGGLCLYIYEGKCNPLSLAFSTLQNNQPRRIAEALPGEILGVTAFLDMSPNVYMLKANQESLVLSIPIAALTPKLQQDPGFASRFYQALASLTAERMFQIVIQLEDSARYEPGCSLCDTQSYSGELGVADLQKLSLARARFNWMLQQLGVKG
ncbi:MAG: cyclic nucleotide-binding domain-containing protein [Oscillatoriophycideae cyanobacterium NC_groundwater_1537_Pr4_S-0.65um_50_18]|nr:cyclic nucleotide-binding domain-containing protein [Oscillatoriophycideae cyanobacterium NC_groundwater_1537_Pr4_S-0.65um_50_18]